MGFNRTWLEDSGSEDSHGRTLWALGECARRDASPSRRLWASALFAEALSTAENFRSPRAWAFTLLGLDSYCAVTSDDLRAQEVRRFLADRLMAVLAAVETPDWVWFEEGLAYDNARLSQALMLTGMATQTPAYVDAGLRSLRWLMTRQTAPERAFSGRSAPPVSATSGNHPRAFDQQPRGSHGDHCRLPDGVAGGWRCRMESHRDQRLSPGFSAAMICPWPLVDLQTEAAVTDCIPSAPMKIAAASPWCPIFSVLPKFASLPALTSARRNLRTCRRRRLNSPDSS